MELGLISSDISSSLFSSELSQVRCLVNSLLPDSLSRTEAIAKKGSKGVALSREEKDRKKFGFVGKILLF